MSFFRRAVVLSVAFATLLAAQPVGASAPVPAGAVLPRGRAAKVGLIVKLDAEPVATYQGGVAGLAATSRLATGGARLAATSTAVSAYRKHLARRIGDFERDLAAAVPGARVLQRFDVVVGGASVVVPEGDESVVRALPGVRAVYRDERRRIAAADGVALIGARAFWGKLGGAGNAGEGVTIGVVDTGVWPEHPSFADPAPDGKPYPAAPGSRACQFAGGAHPGPAFACNGKLIGAYRFMDAYDACPDCPHPDEDFTSARDSVGHGTHTASTAAGNAGVDARIGDLPLGLVSGVAPRARIIAYKVCGPDENGGCFASDSVAAIQQAILDGVDVINYSIGGGTDPYGDPVELAFRDAYAAGIFVAASAGNDGPAPDTVEHLGPWLTTVAATTAPRALRGTVMLVAADGAQLKLAGGSVGEGIDGAAPVVVAADTGDARCLDGAADTAFSGAIVVCERGGNARVAKSWNVARHGARGMILYNDAQDPSQRGVSTDDHFVPTVHLEYDDGAALLAFLRAHSGVTATLSHGMPSRTRGDVLAAFSSRGGPATRIAALKPDVAAPGVQILAGDTPQHADPEQRDGELFQAIDGTSMAAPHVAGAAALLAAARPDWSPGRIKSALMTTATARRLVEEDGATPFDPFDAGAGRIQLRRALDPGLTFDATAGDFADHEADLWTVNQPSVLLTADAPDHVVLTRRPRSELALDTIWTVTVTAPPDVTIMVPPSFAVAARATTTFPIVIDKSAVPRGEVRHALIELRARNLRVRLPVSVVGPRPQPDLVPVSFSVSSPLSPGATLAIASSVRNDGEGRAGRFVASFYLSTDASASDDDVLFSVCNFPFGLDPAATATCNGSLPFMPVTPVAPGSYRVLMVVDDFDEVAESDEGNDVLLQPDPVVVQ
jgi:subtilisin family serine protease